MLRMFFKRNEVDAMLYGFAVDRSKSPLICEICRLGRYMYHCHLLEHEDNGMMAQFEVID